jgi:hypothetical protein
MKDKWSKPIKLEDVQLHVIQAQKDKIMQNHICEINKIFKVVKFLEFYPINIF